MPDEDEELNDALRENALGPKRAQGDSGSIEQHPLADQLEVIRYLKGQQATGAGGVGPRFTKMIPPGQD